MLSHYQIHLMHLRPESITLLALFAFVCEAMVGIPPSVALLCHFFSLRLSDPTQCSGCVSFLAALETAASGIDFGLPPSEAKFKERWLYVDVGVPSPLLSHPTAPAVPSSGWAHEALVSPRLVFVWRRFAYLRALGVTASKVVKEFLLRLIAPLQRHSRRMCALGGREDRMRLQEEDLTPEVLRKVLMILTGDPFPGSIRQGGALLYLCSNKADFVKQMPSFDEWGLHPAGLRGPRENPVVVVALPVAHDGPSSSGGAGRQGPPGAEGATVGMMMPCGTPEAAAPEARPAAAEGVEPRLAAPVAEAPEAPATLHGAGTGGMRQGDAPDAGRIGASSSSQADPCAELLGCFRVDFEALRKRREALGDDYPCRLLKCRKYFPTNE